MVCTILIHGTLVYNDVSTSFYTTTKSPTLDTVEDAINAHMEALHGGSDPETSLYLKSYCYNSKGDHYIVRDIHYVILTPEDIQVLRNTGFKI